VQGMVRVNQHMLFENKSKFDYSLLDKGWVDLDFSQPHLFSFATVIGLVF
jgi:hypothetical protein